MEIVSVTIGILGLVVAALIFYRTRKHETMVRLHLAKLSGQAKRISESAGWASQHFNHLRNHIDSDEWEKKRIEASRSIQKGGGDAASAHRMSRELIRDLHSIQLSMFSKVEHLQSNGKLVELSKLPKDQDTDGEIGGDKQPVEVKA